MTTITHPPETNNGVVTSWLPVTTAWPSIQQCSTDIYSQLGGGVALAFDPYYGRFINTQITCLPPAATLWWSRVLQTPAQTITGLGPLECPQLYTTGTTSVINPMSTFVACCPSNYAFQLTAAPGYITPQSINNGFGLCVSSLTVGQEFTFMSLDTSQGESWAEATTLITTQGGKVYGIQLNGYIFGTTLSATSSNTIPTTAATEFFDTSSNIIPTAAATFMSSTGDSTAANATSLPQITAPVRNGMTSAEVIGVGVGVALALVGLGALIIGVLLIRRHRLNANAERASTASPPLKGRTWVEDFTGNPQYGHRFEMSATPKEI